MAAQDISRAACSDVNFPLIFPLTIKIKISVNEGGQLLCNTAQ